MSCLSNEKMLIFDSKEIKKYQKLEIIKKISNKFFIY